MARLFDFCFRTRETEVNLEPGLAFPKGLQILANPVTATTDIVFAHGLTGDRERTWSSPRSDGYGGCFWPRDWLPTAIPYCRIVTFGYDAYTFLTCVNACGQIVYSTMPVISSMLS